MRIESSQGSLIAVMAQTRTTPRPAPSAPTYDMIDVMQLILPVTHPTKITVDVVIGLQSAR